MRARMVLSYAGIAVDIREISLKDKPTYMLRVSPKGTVPVLVLPDGQVIEESLEIMIWALQQKDIDGWLTADSLQTQQLIAENDGPFKKNLDQYKYAIRFPEHSADYYRGQGEEFLAKLELRLHQTTFLVGNTISLADAAIFPFIRQFAAVDNIWFESTDYLKLKIWLKYMVASELFQGVMEKRQVYSD